MLAAAADDLLERVCSKQRVRVVENDRGESREGVLTECEMFVLRGPGRGSEGEG